MESGRNDWWNEAGSCWLQIDTGNSYRIWMMMMMNLMMMTITVASGYCQTIREI